MFFPLDAPQMSQQGELLTDEAPEVAVKQAAGDNEDGQLKLLVTKAIELSRKQRVMKTGVWKLTAYSEA